jgi:glycosyltransferase involved in cell wall biosynthesis
MISVIIPVVKLIFFEKAVNSILSQSFTDFELIIVNSGSPEDVDSIVRKYTDPRIRYYKHEKLPVIENWNKCLSYADREFCVLFSDDDIAEPDFLKELYELARKYPTVNIFHSRVRIIDKDDNLVSLTSSAPEYETAADFIWHRFKNFRRHFAPEFMCRTGVFRNKGGFVDFLNAWGSDDATWFTMANTGGIASTRKFLCNWRQSNLNITSVGSLDTKLKAIKSFENWAVKFISEELIISDSEKEIKAELLSLLPRKTQIQYAGAFRLSLGTGLSAYFTLLFYWIRYRKEYSLSMFSLAWAFSLIYKDKNYKKGEL